MVRLFLGFALMLGTITAARADTLDNAGIIALSRAGLGDEIIIAKVRALRCNYDFSTASLVALRAAGVGQPVIVEMVRKCTAAEEAAPVADLAPALPAARRAPGIYLSNPLSQASPTMLRAAANVALSYTGNGTFLFPYKATLTVTQARAQVVARSSRPTFTFSFGGPDQPGNTSGAAAGWSAQSPEEFSLVRFKTEGNIRQLAIGRRSPGLDMAGIDPKVTLPFTVEQVGDGVYRVTMPDDLPPGQYGFITVGEETRSKSLYRIYDFSVDLPVGTLPGVCPPPRAG